MTPDTPSTRPGSNEFEHSLIEAIHEASPDGILVVDEQGIIVSHNQRMFDVFELDPESELGGRTEMIGRLDQELLAPALKRICNADVFLARVHELYENPQIEDFAEVVLKDGRTLERHSRALWSGDGRYLGRVWFFRDVTFRKNLERQLSEFSFQDSLTGVANRRYFLQRLTDALTDARRSAGPLSLITVDIDHFKAVNDTWGHATGDAVLKNLAKAATEALRKDDLFGRIGGEEFCVLLPGTDLEEALVLAERLRSHVESQAVPHAEGVIRYTISAGVAMAGDESPDGLLQRADRALYAAKQAGRNKVARG